MHLFIFVLTYVISCFFIFFVCLPLPPQEPKGTKDWHKYAAFNIYTVTPKSAAGAGSGSAAVGPNADMPVQDLLETSDKPLVQYCDAPVGDVNRRSGFTLDVARFVHDGSRVLREKDLYTFVAPPTEAIAAANAAAEAKAKRAAANNANAPATKKNTFGDDHA